MKKKLFHLMTTRILCLNSNLVYYKGLKGNKNGHSLYQWCTGQAHRSQVYDPFFFKNIFLIYKL